MKIFHSIASKNELLYIKYLRRVKALYVQFPKNKQLRLIHKICAKKSYTKINTHDKKARDCMKMALQFSIHVFRQDVAFDLIAYSVEKSFALTITEKEL